MRVCVKNTELVNDFAIGTHTTDVAPESSTSQACSVTVGRRISTNAAVTFTSERSTITRVTMKYSAPQQVRNGYLITRIRSLKA